MKHASPKAGSKAEASILVPGMPLKETAARHVQQRLASRRSDLLSRMRPLLLSLSYHSEQSPSLVVRQSAVVADASCATDFSSMHWANQGGIGRK